MTSPADFPLSLAESTDLIATERSTDLSQEQEVELVFTQDVLGRYLSFYWQGSERYGLEPQHIIGSRMDENFGPAAIAPYLGRVRRVLDYLTPERFKYPFRCADQYLLFELVISPILMPQEPATTAIVMGKLLFHTPEAQALQWIDATPHQSLPPSSDRYQKLLTQVTWNIRRTLDLETIWQQTVNGLGRALGVDRCLICPYKSSQIPVQVVAEYHHESLSSVLGLKLEDVADGAQVSHALTTLQPVMLNQTQADSSQQQSVLIIATCYQDQPNGLIILQQYDQSRIWSDADIELVQELADQVGTAIAHATLFSESQTLANELQRVNDNLMQKHRELEEARHQAEEASRLKSEFLANTSHELRTPLNGMIGFLKLVMDGMADDPAEQGEFIAEAYRSAVHLLSIINDILDIAKIEAGKMQLELSPVKLDELLSDVENFIRPQAQQKNLGFEIRTPATRDEVVLSGNYQRLLQVMLNLVGNAIKFTHEGGVTVSAEVIPKKTIFQDQESPGMVKISVADTGIGVSLDKQDKLFQSFSQVDSSRTRQYGGTGLGLAISQKLMEAMGGVVNFYSMGEGLGSTVTFTVPLYQDPVMISDSLPIPSMS